MAHHLTMALVETILSLHQRGWSQRRIADELGVHRETVARHLRLAGLLAKPANAPIGSPQEADPSKPAIAPIGSPESDITAKPAIAPIGFPDEPSPPTEPSAARPAVGRPSECEPYRALIVSLLEQGLSAQRIYQDLTAEHGFTGSYYSVRRFTRKLEAHLPLPFRRLESAPGEEVQVDFGTGAPLLLAEGKRRRTHVFRVVLSFSRKAYSEAVTRQTTEDFLRCLENAFRHFGGVPRRVVLDNLKAAVKKVDWFDPELNPKVEAFARHHGTVFLPTRPYTPRHKGKVERGVAYVQDNALKGRTFPSLDEQNQFLAHWEQTVADQRLHGTTRRQVGGLFREVEQAALQALPAAHFPCFHEARRTVHRDGHVEVARAFYSVPPEYLGRQVWARWDGRLVRLFDSQMRPIAVHPQREPGRFSTLHEHIVSEKIHPVERGAAWLVEQARLIGPGAARWAEAVLAGRGVEGLRVLQGLRSLAQRHRTAAIDRACDIALSHGALHLRTVRALIEREATPPAELPFLDEHELIRPLAEYSLFLSTSVSQGDLG